MLSYCSRMYQHQQEKWTTSHTTSDSTKASMAFAPTTSSSSTPSTNASQNASWALHPAATISTSKSGSAVVSQWKAPDISANLDTDGCLCEEECKQRRERNLCLYCGDAVHMVNQCPKIPSDCHAAGGTTAIGRATFVISPSEEPFVDLSTALLESEENDCEVQT